MASVETEITTSPENSDHDTVSSASSNPSRHSPNLMKDIYLWKNKKRSASIVAIATAIWVMLKVCGFNFLTVVCWVTMIIVTSRHAGDFFLWEISGEFAMVSQNAFLMAAEGGIVWMFKVGVEDKWFIFVGIIAGVLIVMSVPFLLFTYEDNINGFRDRMECEAQGRRWYRTVGDRFRRETKSEHKITEDEAKNKVAEDEATSKVAEDKAKKVD
ncbi:reticulon-like protein B13 [Telopea speciosissima]|uniref:reticulon-like protein B13 n=1 Tax=Telopea speciosissima TaxID=54955 RepID=UPI001CC63D76|nr:reticulon-like protein B13 [Telopea speciosissima]